MSLAGGARIIRARRYVSAPAGTYPAPLPVGGEPVTGVAAPTAAQAATTIRASAEQLAAAAEPAVRPPAAARPEPVVRPSRKPVGRSQVGRLVAMLAGGVLGTALGVAVGAALLALQDAPRWLERITDLRALWQSADDPIVLGSVGAVVAGFALIGLLWPLRRR